MYGDSDFLTMYVSFFKYMSFIGTDIQCSVSKFTKT